MTDEFLQWLRAQLDDDAELAASGETWTAFDEATQGTRRVDVDHSIERVVACTRAWRGLHIARHDPARVLAEVDAKRRILARHTPHDMASEDHIRHCERDHWGTPVCNHDGRAWPCPDALDVAAPYADRPGYRDDWRP